MTGHWGSPTQDMVFYPWGNVWLNWGGGGLEFADLDLLRHQPQRRFHPIPRHVQQYGPLAQP